ncbi:MAG TPA: rod shape-determining protein MreC [Thermoanaerobaculia bacterium]|nr:rod shape-determining protein MreC [Thermoanaerobaculia bacterium]
MSERRIGWIFVVLLCAQLVMLASRAPVDGSDRSLLATTGLRAVAPLGRLTAAAADAFSGVGEGLKARRALLAENRALREEVERLRLESTRLQGLEREAEQLADALSQVRREPSKLRPATVVYLDQKSWLRTLVLYTGASAEVNQPVLASSGLVGRVVKVAGSYAKVQMLSDPEAGVGALLEGSRRQGVLRGAGGGRLLLEYVPRQTEVTLGERVLTAGIDGVYPPGILIGTVAGVSPGSELFYAIDVEPTVDFAALSQVFLLSRENLPEDLTGAGR